ncbi:MAG: hypothetical protein QXS19_06640 [Candidatus Methanomethylicia archaeon]
MPNNKEAIINKIKNDSNTITPKHKVGDTIILKRSSLKISYKDKGITVTAMKDGEMYILWKETLNYMDLIQQDTFEVVVKKIILVNNKISYICRLSFLEK